MRAIAAGNTAAGSFEEITRLRFPGTLRPTSKPMAPTDPLPFLTTAMLILPGAAVRLRLAPTPHPVRSRRPAGPALPEIKIKP